MAVMMLLPLQALAQPVQTIEVGKSYSREAGSAGSVDMYQFAAASGATLRADVAGSGRIVLILYTPAGEEMLSAEGNGNVTLEVVLPRNDVFFLSVVQAGSARPYQLVISGNDPDPLLSLFAQSVGYRSPEGRSICWVVPGQQMKKIYARGSGIGEEIYTLGRGNKIFTNVVLSNGDRLSTEHEVVFSGDTANVTVRRSDGKQFQASLNPYEQVSETMVWNKYLCD